MLTRAANFDNLEKFAQNTVARPVSTTRKPHSVHTAHQVRGHKAVALPWRWSLIQNCSPSANAVRIFDNIVERASREMTQTLVESFSLVISSAPFRASGGAWPAGPPSWQCRATKIKREFDPGSESTLAACLTHASRTRKGSNT